MQELADATARTEEANHQLETERSHVMVMAEQEKRDAAEWSDMQEKLQVERESSAALAKQLQSVRENATDLLLEYKAVSSRKVY